MKKKKINNRINKSDVFFVRNTLQIAHTSVVISFCGLDQDHTLVILPKGTETA